MTKYIFRCKECGSTDIQIKCWVNPNTNEIIDDCEEKECWCEKCEAHQRFEGIKIDD